MFLHEKETASEEEMYKTIFRRFFNLVRNNILEAVSWAIFIN